MAHMVHEFDLEQVLHAPSCAPVRSTPVETEDEARQLAMQLARAAGHPFVVDVIPDPDLCEDIPAYARISNIAAGLVPLFPDLRCWRGKMIDAIDPWSAKGIHTPRELHDHLNGLELS